MKKQNINIIIYGFIILIIICGGIFYFINKSKNNEKNLLFKLESTMLKCPSPVLYVYDDNTYEYYYKIVVGEDNSLNNPSVGNYSYDVKKILNNIPELPDGKLSAYKLEYNNDFYLIPDNYSYLRDFLESIDINIHSCGDVTLN